MNKLFVVFNPAKLLVWFTFFHALYALDKNTLVKKLFFIILSINFFTEVFTSVLYYNSISVSLLTSLNIILHNSIWIYILLYVFKKEKFAFWLLTILGLFSFVNLLFFEGTTQFNYLTFVVSSFCYVVPYIYFSFSFLKKENLFFFKSSNFLLVSAPLPFFLGLSFMFAFQTKLITTVLVFNNITLFMVISYLVNFIYYGVLNYYIKISKNG